MLQIILLTITYIVTGEKNVVSSLLGSNNEKNYFGPFVSFEITMISLTFLLIEKIRVKFLFVSSYNGFPNPF